MTWLVDLGELLAKNHSSDIGRISAIVNRNPDIPYLQRLGESVLPKSKLSEAKETKKIQVVTPRDIIRNNLRLSKVKDEGVNKQREYLMIALAKGEEVGAQEIFLRQDNLTLEAIINLSSSKPSIWLETLSRLAIDRLQERNRSVKSTGKQLTGREVDVLRYLVSENSITEIGQILHISKNTMKTHLRNIYKKLDVNGRDEAATKAKENFII